MKKIEIVQRIFDNTDFKTYLEIGSQNGWSFLPMKAKYKTAVDPQFTIPFKRKAKWLLKVPSNINNKYFEEESDTFFEKRKAYLDKIGPLDIVLVDGLHTFRAALNDVLNSLKYLNKKGLIVMHDCYPPHKAAGSQITKFPNWAAMEQVEGWDGLWCGDVWKAVVYLKKNMSSFLDIATIDTDFGLGMVRIKSAFTDKDLIVDEASFAAIDELTYEQMVQDRTALLNFKPVDYADRLIGEVIAANKK